VPDVGERKPANARIKVVFPEPLTPIIPIDSFFRATRVTPRSAWTVRMPLRPT